MSNFKLTAVIRTPEIRPAAADDNKAQGILAERI